jgi:hypothetical protein
MVTSVAVSLNDWGYVEVRLSRHSVEMPDLKHFLELNAWRLAPGREEYSTQYWRYWMPRIFARYLIQYADVMEETYRYHRPQWAAYYLNVARRTYNHLYEVSPVNAATDPNVWRRCGS